MFAASKTDSASTGGYEISRSLRFNNPTDTAYLNRTPATTTNRTTFTFSVWVKRGLVDTNYRTLFSNAGAVDYILFWDTTGLSVQNLAGNYQVITTQVFRDPSAWYHLVIAMDTTQATSSDRIKIYVNGVQVTAFAYSTYPPQNFNTGYNTATAQYIGWNEYNYYNGYMTEVNFIDGQQLTPSSFGETNAQTGVWQPKAFSGGAYGTNGFYLNFSDNSNTTAATLGKDYSGNGNNWTPNNFSVSAGAGNDSLVDVPTPYGIDTGAGGTVRGNYCTLNPLDTFSSVSMSDGNLLGNKTGGSISGVTRSTFGVSSGKWYWEATQTNTGGVNTEALGVADNSTPLSTYLGESANSWAYWNGSQKYNNGVGITYGTNYTIGDVIGIALDMDAGTITFYKNGTSQGQAFSGITGTQFPAFTAFSNSVGGFAFNFGQRPFAYTAPSGFKALCTQNLPTPTIGATTATQAGKFFNPVLYTGTSATQSITGVGFQPDFTWIKRRDSANDNNVYDSVRGSTSGYVNQLVTNSSDAENKYGAGFYGAVSAFSSDGFSVASANSSWLLTNTSSGTYVAWNWRASNATAVTNTSGSLTSSVSANTTSGFSIVTYTGNSAANQTVGHGLGVAPAWVIVKTRDATAEWITYHSVLGPTNFLYLNLTAGSTSVADYWGTPSATTFGVKGGGWGNNLNGVNYVAYCFAPIAGYSAFGSYTGNGSTDGPFVFTGMRPAYILFKCSSAAGENWLIFDTTRSTYNVAQAILYANLSNAEDNSRSIDILSNGFKIRDTSTGVNASGATYIYMAFATSPFKYSLAR